MAEENRQRRAKATGASTHRTGTLRAAVKPQTKAATGAKQIIETYLASLNPASLKHTIWGASATQNAQVLRTNFGLAATDEPYLLLDAGDGTGRAGMVLSTAGVHIANGKGGVTHTAWAEFAKVKVGCQNGMLVVGQAGIVSSDAQAISTLLQTLQTKLAK